MDILLVSGCTVKEPDIRSLQKKCGMPKFVLNKRFIHDFIFRQISGSRHLCLFLDPWLYFVDSKCMRVLSTPCNKKKNGDIEEFKDMQPMVEIVLSLRSVLQ